MVSIQTSRGEVTGTLSSSTSGILLNPDQGFVHVRMIMMDRGSSLPNISFISSKVAIGYDEQTLQVLIL